MDKFIWLGFQLAAEEVERTLGVSWGAAQKSLLDACKCGDVASRQGDPGHGPDVTSVSFERWLQAKAAPSKKTRRSPVRDTAQEAIDAIWPDGRIPPNVRNSEIVKLVSDRIVRQKGQLPSPDTILRAAGRKGMKGNASDA